jgi:hypothetical protein
MDWDKDVSSSPARKEMSKWVARIIYSEKQITYILRKVKRDDV